jgi:hypothetical protein
MRGSRSLPYPTPRIGWAELAAYRPRAPAPMAANGVGNLFAIVVKGAQELQPERQIVDNYQSALWLGEIGRLGDAAQPFLS